jgi:hypothetical protein
MRNLILLTLVIFLGCCSNGKEGGEATLEITNHYVNIQIGAKEINNSTLIEYFKDKGKNYIAIRNDRNRSIDVYNIDNQELYRQIKIEEEGVNAFTGHFGFSIKNLDTIFLISNFHPRVGIINENGELLKTIQCSDSIGNWFSIVSPAFTRRAFHDGSHLYIMHELAIRNYQASVTSEDLKTTETGVIVNYKTSEIKSFGLNYPHQLVGKDIFNMNKSWTKGHNNFFVYSLTIFGELFVTNNFKNFEVVPYQSPYKMYLPEKLRFGDIGDLVSYQMQRDAIYSLIYDEYREVYYVLVRKRETNINEKEPFQYNSYPNCFIIILDKDFKHISDVHFPDNTYSFKNMFVNQDGLYISEDNVSNPTYSEDALRFRLFRFVKK